MNDRTHANYLSPRAIRRRSRADPIQRCAGPIGRSSGFAGPSQSASPRTGLSIAPLRGSAKNPAEDSARHRRAARPPEPPSLEVERPNPQGSPPEMIRSEGHLGSMRDMREIPGPGKSGAVPCAIDGGGPPMEVQRQCLLILPQLHRSTGPAGQGFGSHPFPRAAAPPSRIALERPLATDGSAFPGAAHADADHPPCAGLSPIEAGCLRHRAGSGWTIPASGRRRHPRL